MGLRYKIKCDGSLMMRDHAGRPFKTPFFSMGPKCIAANGTKMDVQKVRKRQIQVVADFMVVLRELFYKI